MQTEPIEHVHTSTTMTTLFDLIDDLNTKVGQDRDDLITATVMAMIAAGRLTFVRGHKACLAQIT